MRISVHGLRKTFRPERGQAVTAVDGISLEVQDGEFLVILGPSGSGKTTLLRCIAGLERADDGAIVVDGKLVFSAQRRVWVAPERRGISMVFQSYALWPHMTVSQNVAYPLQTRRIPQAEIGPRVQRALDLVGCGTLGARHPSQLSGGQQQRVALARAIVSDSRVVLFDEPLSSVDARVRDELRRELATLQDELGFTAVYITHDQMEATLLGDRVAVLADGAIAQIGPPRELYARPASRYVAEFMGAANQYAGTVEAAENGGTVVRTEIGRFEVTREAASPRAGEGAIVIFRPESIQVSAERPADARNAWQCSVEEQHFLGSFTEYRLRVNGVSVLARSMSSRLLAPGTSAWASIDPDRVHVVPGQ